MALKESRAYDALFDTTYTVSGARDHYKQQGQAGYVLQQVPEHSNFFSDLKHFPKSTFRVKANTQLPATIDRSFHPHHSTPQLLKWQSSPQQVNGPQLYKYFKRPLLPAGATLTQQLRLAPQQPIATPPAPPPEPASKDAGTQSDYRESEAQTLPWSPDWVLPTNPAVLAKQAALCAKFNIAGPEVLQLAHLTFGNGLPGGLQEVRRLEKLRAKRAFEASLPPIDDMQRLPQRQAMIEAWEVQEWVERKEEIKGVQEERLALLAQALQVREEEIEAAHREQVQRRSAAMLASKANKFAAIHTERLKTFRQLATAKDKLAGTLDRRNKSTIIQQYADYGSPLYAPPQRDGHFPDVIPAGAATAGQLSHTCGSGSSGAGGKQQQLHPAMFAPSSISGLAELEASLPKKALQPAAQQQRVSTTPQKLTYKQRTEAAVQQDVETIHDMLQAAKAATGTRGIGKVCPLDDAPASAAVLAAAAAAAAGAEGHGSSRNRLRSVGGKSGVGSLAAAAAAAAAAATGTAGRPSHSARSAAARAGASNAAASQGPAEAPPLPDPDGTHAAPVLLQRLLRGRAVQDQMHAGKESRLQLIRELRLGLEGTGGGQPRPEVRDAATQERDAAAGAALCRLCCLLASDDQAAIAQVLSSVAERRAGQQQQQQTEQEQQPQQQGEVQNAAELGQVAQQLERVQLEQQLDPVQLEQQAQAPAGSQQGAAEDEQVEQQLEQMELEQPAEPSAGNRQGAAEDEQVAAAEEEEQPQQDDAQQQGAGEAGPAASAEAEADELPAGGAQEGEVQPGGDQPAAAAAAGQEAGAAVAEGEAVGNGVQGQDGDGVPLEAAAETSTSLLEGEAVSEEVPAAEGGAVFEVDGAGL